MPDMQKMTERDLIEYLDQRGYVFVREYYPFGRLLTFEDKESGVRKYYLGGRLLDWAQICTILRRDWVPQSAEDVSWKAVNIGLSATGPVDWIEEECTRG